MKNKNTGFIIPLLITIVALLIVGGGFYFYVNKNLNPLQVFQKSFSNEKTIITSNYGFSFNVPAGWHIWEGQSASGDLSNLTDFVSFMSGAVTTKESGKEFTTDEIQKFKNFQDFMNNWNVSSSTVIVLTNGNLNYADRDLATAGKYSSTQIDSTETLKFRRVDIVVSSGAVDIKTAATSTNGYITKIIDINNQKAKLAISKVYKVVDPIIIFLPINSDKYVDGKKVQSLIFSSFGKKDDEGAVQDLIYFIESLHLSYK